VDMSGSHAGRSTEYGTIPQRRAKTKINHMYADTCEKAAENGAWGGCFRRRFHRTPTREPRRFKPFSRSCAKPSTRRLFPDSSPSLPTFYKGPILAPRPLSPKWTSLDFLRVVPGNTYGTLSPALHRPRFLTRPPSLTLTFTSFTT
jgi:hypothetical protein